MGHDGHLAGPAGGVHRHACIDMRVSADWTDWVNEMESGKSPNFRTLRIVQIVAVTDAILVSLLALFLMGQFSDPELVPLIICAASAGIVFSAIFYFGCLIFEPSLLEYIKEDRTVIKGESVEMVTDTHTSGDARIDEWVNRFVFARNLFGMSVIPLLILGGLYLGG